MITKKNKYYRTRAALASIRFRLMIGMIVVSAVMGIVLAYFVGWPLFWMGLYCYLIGIFYSSGPRPLSSLPLGEFFQDLRWAS